MQKSKMPVLMRQHPAQLVVVTTDLWEAETLIKDRAAQVQQAAPEQFAGEDLCVFFKLQYVQPCDHFKELRRLILEVRDHTGLRADFKGIVAVEASQWLGHEQEEYFTVVLKYLFDHRHCWQPVMVLHSCSQSQLQRFTGACAAYMTPRVVREELFGDRDRLVALLGKKMRDRGCTLRGEALEQLAQVLMSPAYTKARGLALAERVADELVAVADRRKEITTSQLQKYLEDSGSTLALLGGRSSLRIQFGGDREGPL